MTRKKEVKKTSLRDRINFNTRIHYKVREFRQFSQFWSCFANTQEHWNRELLHDLLCKPAYLGTDEQINPILFLLQRLKKKKIQLMKQERKKSQTYYSIWWTFFLPKSSSSTSTSSSSWKTSSSAHDLAFLFFLLCVFFLLCGFLINYSAPN